jgi:hypothetical protein
MTKRMGKSEGGEKTLSFPCGLLFFLIVLKKLGRKYESICRYRIFIVLQ